MDLPAARLKTPLRQDDKVNFGGAVVVVDPTARGGQPEQRWCSKGSGRRAVHTVMTRSPRFRTTAGSRVLARTDGCPLGITVHHETGDLYVADPCFPGGAGILRITREGSVGLLTGQDHRGKKARMTGEACWRG